MSNTAVEVGIMKVAQIAAPGAAFQIVERQIPEPGAGQVRIKVQACRSLPQRCADERGSMAGNSVSADSGS